MYSFARTLEKVLLFLQRWMEGQACDKAECRTAEIVAVIHGASRRMQSVSEIKKILSPTGAAIKAIIFPQDSSTSRYLS
ncbi:hypothetical protein OPV22_023359 [Ensete ventricosum]|uniref:Uncharacterized protein n=1 Tax=Ensete ventricosum TaxID=4639 RepID=A0AAV8QV96_ENSVE|nr:hypothetical protein OPV22_023359 [Ensete ventricosum]